MAKTFDGPPTLERSGFEHRRAVTSFLLRRKAWLEVELSLQERRRGRKKPFLMLKKDGMILELLIIRTKVKTRTMNIIKTEIEGVLIIEPRLFRDSRGYFFESFSEREFEEKVAPILGHSVLYITITA